VSLHCRRSDSPAVVIQLESVRTHKNRLLIRIAGVEDTDAAAAYAGGILFAPRADVALQPGEYFDDDLVGCEVVGAGGKVYGRVERVEHLPSSDMLVIEGRMVPMVVPIVTGIDLARRRILIDPPEGLLE
jgi:16S rRNA processing protein RimM